MKQLTFASVFLVLASISLGQTSFKSNTIYLEAGGSGLFGSINYEKQVTSKPGLGIRVGVGFYSEKGVYVTIPVGVSYLFELKNRKSFIEAGIGATWSRFDGEIFNTKDNYNESHFFSFVPSVGFRRNTNKNLMWRISFTPVINKNSFAPWLGFSIGKSF